MRDNPFLNEAKERIVEMSIRAIRTPNPLTARIEQPIALQKRNL